ncbi:MAG: hypothetical protein RRZ24_05920 [Clostridia bacterium]
MQKETRPPTQRSLLQRITMAIQSNKKLELAVYGGLILIVVGLYAATLVPKGTTPSTVQSSVTSPGATAEEGVEERLREVLACIRGAGHVEVMITYETGTELVAAMSTNVNSNASETNDGEKTSTTTQTTESSQPATFGGGGGDEPIILMQKQPVVRGVIVVAEGAADIKVKLDLQRAVMAVLDIPISRIEVFESALMGSK